MNLRPYRWWITTVIALLIVGGAGLWVYMNMLDLPRIKTDSGCQCGGINLEQSVRNAQQIHTGRITRITKDLNGIYRITVHTQESLKGQTAEDEMLRYEVSPKCPYPFRKGHTYIFMEPSTSTAIECSQILNASDLEMLAQINRWLNRSPDRSERTDDPDRSDDRTSGDGGSLDGAWLIFDALMSGQGSIRVEEEDYRTWLYDDDDALFFYSPSAKISFFIPLSQQITATDYEQFVEGISITRSSNGRPVAFALGEVSMDVKELPVVIKLFDAPAEDLIIHFASPDRNEVYEAYVHYIEPFTYTIYSTSDPGMAYYADILQSGYQAVYHVVSGLTHMYTIDFNQPVDRSSVYESLNESLQQYPTIAWSLQWMNDHEVRLTLVLDEDSTDEIQFSLHGIRTEDGYQLYARETFILQPSEPKLFQAIDLASDTKEVYFTSITPYAIIDVSPGGSYLLTGYAGHNGLHAVYQYTIRDRFGGAAKQFTMDEIREPLWISDDELAYIADQQLFVHNLTTDESRMVWQPPGMRQEEKIVSLDYSSVSERFAIGAGYQSEDGGFIYDLYVLDGLDDPEPIVIEAFGSFECIEGGCFAPSLMFTADDALMYARWEAAAHEGYEPILYRTDLESLSTTRIAPKPNYYAADPMMFPLPDGKVLYVADTSEYTVEFDDLFGGVQEQWAIYDPVSATFTSLFSTSLGLYTDHWLEQVVPIQQDQVLIDVSNSGWYLIDLQAKRINRYPDLPQTVDIIDVEAGRIWYME